MAFQVKELMIPLEPTPLLAQEIPPTKPPCSCSYPSSPMVACGLTDIICPTVTGFGLAAPDSRRNLESLRRDLGARSAS